MVKDPIAFTVSVGFRLPQWRCFIRRLRSEAPDMEEDLAQELRFAAWLLSQEQPFLEKKDLYRLADRVLYRFFTKTCPFCRFVRQNGQVKRVILYKKEEQSWR